MRRVGAERNADYGSACSFGVPPRNHLSNVGPTLQFLLKRLMNRHLKGPGCAARFLETAARGLFSWLERLWSTVRFRGTEHQRWLHHFERTLVYTEDLVGTS
jgi:hypothetical protein